MTHCLLDVTEDIANQGYVLVRGEDKVITGIVTASDFAVQFRRLAEPFLVIEEIERYLRRLVDGVFSADEITEALSTLAERSPFVTQTSSLWANTVGSWSHESAGTGSTCV